MAAQGIKTVRQVMDNNFGLRHWRDMRCITLGDVDCVKFCKIPGRCSGNLLWLLTIVGLLTLMGDKKPEKGLVFLARGW